MFGCAIKLISAFARRNSMAGQFGFDYIVQTVEMPFPITIKKAVRKIHLTYGERISPSCKEL